jgi:pyruvate dehydrogenase E2 component (dihydrolipoamide acetyltransferase)
MPVKILMPALSPTMTEGNLLKWHKQEGDQVKAGDLLAEIETDKATMEIEAVEEGVLARIMIPGGTDNVKVNDVIALLLEEGEEAADLDKIELAAPPAQATQPATSASAETATMAIALAPATGERILASPLARRIAEQSKLDLKNIDGTGPRGRIVKADVEAKLASGVPPKKQTIMTFDGPTEFEKIALTGMRKVIAQRLVESKQTVPHFYLTVECEVDQLLELRKQVNDGQSDVKVSVNDLIIKACAAALMKVPEANASWAGDHIRQYTSADISVAVAIEGGLITPIIRHADKKGILEIAQESKVLIERAREGKLLPEEYQGGTFSISNLGMFGIKDFSAIINPPQGAILAVGAADQRAVVKHGELKIATVMNCTLSVDHRVVDGAAGAAFLKSFKQLITHPALILI